MLLLKVRMTSVCSVCGASTGRVPSSCFCYFSRNRQQPLLAIGRDYQCKLQPLSLLWEWITYSHIITCSHQDVIAYLSMSSCIFFRTRSYCCMLQICDHQSADVPGCRNYLQEVLVPFFFIYVLPRPVLLNPMVPRSVSFHWLTSTVPCTLLSVVAKLFTCASPTLVSYTRVPGVSSVELTLFILLCLLASCTCICLTLFLRHLTVTWSLILLPCLVVQSES